MTSAVRQHAVGTEDANRAVVSRFLSEVLNGRRFDRAEAFLAPGSTDHLAGSLTAFLTFAAFPDFQIAVEHLVAEDDLVTALATFTGTHSHEIIGIAPTNRGVSGRVAFTFRLRDGRITETWTEIEPWGLLEQLGEPATVF